MIKNIKPVTIEELNRVHPLPAEKGRECYDFPLPEIHSIGSTHYTKAQVLGLMPHVHMGAWEFHYVSKGVVEWWVGNETCEVPPGYLHITAPDLTHGGVGTVMQPCKINWIQISIPKNGELPGLDADDARLLVDSLAGIKSCHYPAPALIGELLQSMVDEFRSQVPGFKTVTRNLLNRFLIEMMRARRTKRAEGSSSKSMAKVIAWIEEHLTERLTVQGMALVAGMNSRRLHGEFVVATGFAPLEYIVHRRIHRARRMLCNSHESITSIALDLGFPSSQYFATAFKLHTGITPGVYRQRYG